MGLVDGEGTMGDLVRTPDGHVEFVPLTAAQLGAYKEGRDTNYMLYAPFGGGSGRLGKVDEIDTYDYHGAKAYFDLTYPDWEARGWEIYLRIRRNKSR